MTLMMSAQTPDHVAFSIHVRGLVQGVGFRPMVWRLAQRLQLRGYVLNDGAGVRIVAIGDHDRLQLFVAALTEQPPALARIDEIRLVPTSIGHLPPDFSIKDSESGPVSTGVVPDAATCPDCTADIFNPADRRYRHPFATCTHCGPRLTIQEHIPYDRSGTTMKPFQMCPACATEFRDPNDRRFHAQPIACHNCGPRIWLERADGLPLQTIERSTMDAIEAACTLLQQGHLVAVKGLGGFQLACDATQEAAVSRLRRWKARDAKPFALMAGDVHMITQYAQVTPEERLVLESPAAPIVILHGRPDGALAPSVAPGVRTLGFMLPNTPLHHLLLRRINRPIVLTSGNRSDEPQCIDNDLAKVYLGPIAEYVLLHDRRIAQRVDDSLTAVVAGVPRVLRRSRGYAPAPIPLPSGFDQAPHILAMGGALKNTFCLFSDRGAILSHHIGDLEEALTLTDYRRALRHYADVFGHTPEMISVDAHPDYLSTKVGKELAAARSWPVSEVQHHHAHIAACLVDNGIPVDHPPVLGIALDGLGYGERGQLWGGEFLMADYRTAVRVGTFKPVRLLGGEYAVKEPWRNTYAHLMAALGWARVAMNYADLDLYHFLDKQPRGVLDTMLTRGINSPEASSCGRLFDAVAAAMGLCRASASYEGQAAVELEQLVDRTALEEPDDLAYPFAIASPPDTTVPYLEPRPMWEALLDDLRVHTPCSMMAARFHKGLALAICAMADTVTTPADGQRTIRHVALSGGVFQNRVLFELVTARLERMGFAVLTHRHVPSNDGGLSLGQGAVAAARALSPLR